MDNTQISALSHINRELEEKVTKQRAKDLNLPYVDVAVFPINPDVLRHVAPEDAARAIAIPFFKSGKRLRLAVADPDNAETQALIEKLKQKGLVPEISLASHDGIQDAHKVYVSQQYKAEVEVKNIVEKEEVKYEKELENLAQLKDELIKLPAEGALNMLSVSAIKAGASDIHLQPEESSCAVRFRIDGVLHNVFEIPKEIFAHIADQLKYKSKMKLNVTTVPQDGRFRFVVSGRNIDVRVASLPTEFGEAFVCRILDPGKHFSTFEELGFSENPLAILKKATSLTQGMVLATGPTSSGKTTTLYVLLQHFNKPELKIITLEDPIEYHLRGVTQSQVDEKRNYTFATGLRSILRQDPNVVMIGEVRDLETAQVATQAALTGHVVLSTLHTNSALEAIPRLLAIGIPAFMLAPALSIIIAQRLVRKLCSCAVARAISAKEKKIFEEALPHVASPAQLKKTKGCDVCNFTGYRGQTVVAEALELDDEMRDTITQEKPMSELFALARKKGMRTMKEDALSKVIEGITTLEEIHRVINA